ncbi:LptF/LptG family permease [Rhizobium sp. L1K21]|uniref:LptF/LptG family permease n=1 Tax=Rhizobium sp. L1K21 TaxID=2954933 RepID=UPI0020924E5B|nr:LptF/LptG family permease [Rhizobium sp. L1K21]MCO6186515.1 LptF/LptG family permease [Rhizobium sp. L1K21]
MKLLQRYIAGRIVIMALSSIIPILAVIWIIQVLGRVNLVTDTGQSIGSFLKLAALMLPTVVPLVLPFGIALGVAQVLTTMNDDSEMPIIEAAGAPRSIVVMPVLFVALIASALSFAFDNGVEPIVRAQAKQMIADAYADLLSSVIEEKEFRRIENGLYVQISSRAQGRQLNGLFLADYRNPDEQLIYYAKEGAIDPSGSILIMKNGQINRRTNDGNVSVIRFASYAFDLSSLTEARSKTTLTEIDRDLPFLWNPDPEDPYYKDAPGKFQAELHRRLTEWSFPLVYALVALVIAGDARSHREKRVNPVAIAFGIAFLLRWLSFYISNQSSGDPAMIPVVYAVPIAVSALCIIMIFMTRRLRKSPFQRLIFQIAGAAKALPRPGQNGGGA